jgi:hypothetical protein
MALSALDRRGGQRDRRGDGVWVRVRDDAKSMVLEMIARAAEKWRNCPQPDQNPTSPSILLWENGFQLEAGHGSGGSRSSDSRGFPSVGDMEDWATPWLIAEAAKASGMSVLWAWTTLLLGAAVVLAGGLVFCSG